MGGLVFLEAGLASGQCREPAWQTLQQVPMEVQQTMALATALPSLGFCGSTICGGRLLLLLLGLGWMPPLRAQTTKSGQEVALLHAVLNGTHDFASLPPGFFVSLTCEEVAALSKERVWELVTTVRQKNITLRVDQLRCLARLLPKHFTPEDLDALPLDLLLFFNPAIFPGPQACANFFSHISKANLDILPRRTLERQRLLPAALTCQGVHGFQVSKADVHALGSLACDLPGKFVAESSEALLPYLASCQGPLDQDQEEAAREALRAGTHPYGPPSRWSVSTLDALQGLLIVLDDPIVHSIPKGVIAKWLQRTSRYPSWLGPELIAVLPRFRRDAEKKACPPEKKPYKVDKNLILYQNSELEACVDGSMLATHMGIVNSLPFTYEQLKIFKNKLDKTYPQGYPESLIKQLGYFFRYISPEEIRRWNMTSPETVKTLLKASKGQKIDAQVTALITQYLLGGGQLHEDTLKDLPEIWFTFLCDLSPQELDSIPPRIMWLVRPQDLDKCSQQRLDVLYRKARLAFQNISRSEYYGKIQAFLGGASMEDLRALSQQNVSMDLATFKKLQVKALVGLTVAEIQKLLGPNIVGLKAEEGKSPVRDWILQQRQEDLDRLGLGLQGGIPSGYLSLNFNPQDTTSLGTPLHGPGMALSWIPALLLALMPS